MRTIAIYLLVACSSPLLANEFGTDSLKAVINEQVIGMVDAENDAQRAIADSILYRALSALLGHPEALQMDLQDLPIARVDAPDGMFRLLTYNVPADDGSHTYRGLLLRKDRKQNKLIELVDATAELKDVEYQEHTPDRWLGAIYYDVLLTKKGGKTYYTLLGWKGFNKIETHKVIEVLSFAGSRVRIGAPLFEVPNARPKSRVLFKFSFQVSMALRRGPEEGQILFDHLSPSRPDLAGQPSFYGPDLSYDRYIWDRSGWHYERDVDMRDQNRDTRPWNKPPRDPGSGQ